MQQGPLTADELEWLDDILMNHGSDEAVIDASELDGLLTATLTGPGQINPEDLQAAIWGGKERHPERVSPQEYRRFVDLISQHMNDIAERLRDYPDQFDPLFGTSTEQGEEVTIVEEWCIGYVKGTALKDWSSLPDNLQPALKAIELHGREENHARFGQMSAEEFEQSLEAIRQAALDLYANWPLH